MKTTFELEQSTAPTATGLRNTPLQAVVQNGILILAIGVETLAWAASPQNGGTLDNLEVIDVDQFAEDVRVEMMREPGGWNDQPESAGWLDCMIQNAADRGSAALKAQRAVATP